MSIKLKVFFAISLLISGIFLNSCFDGDIGESVIANNNARNVIIELSTTNNQKIIATNKKNVWSFDGKDNLKNKVVLVNFWATWCPPCVVEIPHFLNIREKYKNDFEIIGVLMEQNKDINSLNSFISKYKISYPVTTSSQNFILSDAMGGSRGLPTSYLINKKGKVIQVYQGAIPAQMLNDDISKAIKDNK
jgi:thiol-disulfide isomerase/thioredoxin